MIAFREAQIDVGSPTSHNARRDHAVAESSGDRNRIGTGEIVGNLQLSIAVTQGDRTRPIADGSVTADGIDWAVTTVHASEMFWRQLSFAEFDVSEMSMSSLLIDMSHGNSQWVAIPVFTSRSFFHTAALVRTDRGIAKPDAPKGTRG